MTQLSLPTAFIEAQKSILPAEEWPLFEAAVTKSEAVTSIRLNPGKPVPSEVLPTEGARTVPWCPEGRYLAERPSFTLDPLLHAGAYYVQEASSMFVSHVVRSLVHEPVTALDLCASPGGKTTALLASLPEGSFTVSNEIDRRRARILAENVTKWGAPDVIVTANAPADFTPLTSAFGLILADAPCSGEGMFRKDPDAIREWSPRKVDECVNTQKKILRDIWPCLRPGGILIYSTCTYNTREDEEMLAFICDELGAEAIEVPTDASWHIHPPLTGNLPCYRFMPHCTEGEGLFMCAVRKAGDSGEHASARPSRNKGTWKPTAAQRALLDAAFTLPKGYETIVTGEAQFSAFPPAFLPLYESISAAKLYTLLTGVELASVKGRDLIPAHALALTTLPVGCKEYASFEVDSETALLFLRREAVVLPDAPMGYVRLTRQGLGLGWVKNLGRRSNNLYPSEWRIRFK
jgi:16S rRNA C967 or C1407 C5-methylase (RsmB/RsmF family)/NOL1/NOP2/fmu family ribosome biogenesis protein